MSRLKTYYTVDEIRDNLYTTGSQLMLEDGTEYKGSYHSYSTGEVYTETKYIPNVSKKLIKFQKQDTTNYIYKKLKPNIKVKFKTPTAYVTKISSQDITAGVVIRYFIQNINNKTIIEIDSKQFDFWKTNTIDKTIHNAVRISWYISGNKQDIIDNGVLKLGVITKNINQINSVKSRVPGISKILTDPLQYYTDTDFIAPVDINGLDS